MRRPIDCTSWAGGIANANIVVECPRVEALSVWSKRGMVAEKVDIKVSKDEERSFNDAKEVLKPGFRKGAPSKININDTEPRAIEVDLDSK